MNQTTDFIIIGAAILDILAQPANKHVFEIGSSPADHIMMQTGGDAMNEATILTGLGASVRLVTKLGCDSASEYILQHCHKHHIDTNFIIQDSSIDTGINVVLVDETGERHFITSKKGSLRKLSPEDISPKSLLNGKFLSFASIFVAPGFDNQALVHLFQKAKEQNLILCADMTKRKNGEHISDMKECLSYLDYIFPNYEEACLLTGLSDWDEIADAFLNCGVKNIVIKGGARGCFIANAAGRFWVSSYSQVKCVDTTGAGDTFTACFLYGLSQGMTLKECGKFANAGASFCIEHVGATPLKLNSAQILERAQYIQ